MPNLPTSPPSHKPRQTPRRRATRHLARRCARFLTPLALLTLLTGCPQIADTNVPEPIQQRMEPISSREYLLYVSSRYKDTEPVPLVILCHGTTPWDSAKREIRDWVALAEQHNFIVAAPELEGTRGDFVPAAAEQINRQRRDEAVILGIVQHICGAHSIRPTEIFLTGWSAGGFAVLHTGLRHPETFRALAVMTANFEPVFLGDVAGRIDAYQPVFVVYSQADILTGRAGKDTIQWLYDENAYVIDGRVQGPHRTHPATVWKFFEGICTEVPWQHIEVIAIDPDQPYTIRFVARTSFEPKTYDWRFSDGGESPIKSPTHTFEGPGEYKVSLATTTKRNTRVRRVRTFRVPLIPHSQSLTGSP